jgi:CheY-like chemotaxis protein
LILVLTADSALQDQIERAAEAERKETLFLADEDAAWAALQETTPELLLVDLAIASLDAPSVIERLKHNPATAKIPLVAFGNSLRADLLQDAKEAGADQALPRAAFNQQLPELIRHYSKPR